MGLATAITCVAELPCFHYSSAWIRRLGHFGVLQLALFCFAVRYVHLALFRADGRCCRPICCITDQVGLLLHYDKCLASTTCGSLAWYVGGSAGVTASEIDLDSLVRRHHFCCLLVFSYIICSGDCAEAPAGLHARLVVWDSMGPRRRSWSRVWWISECSVRLSLCCNHDAWVLMPFLVWLQLRSQGAVSNWCSFCCRSTDLFAGVTFCLRD